MYDWLQRTYMSMNIHYISNLWTITKLTNLSTLTQMNYKRFEKIIKIFKKLS